MSDPIGERVVDLALRGKNAEAQKLMFDERTAGQSGPRFCVDCQHYQHGDENKTSIRSRRCMRPQLSLVDGQIHPLEADAENERESHGASPMFIYCGPSAQFFQPKDTSPPVHG